MSSKTKTNKSLSSDELKAKASELVEQIFKLRMQLGTGQLSNTAAVRMARKELARVNTYLTQKAARN